MSDHSEEKRRQELWVKTWDENIQAVGSVTIQILQNLNSYVPGIEINNNYNQDAMRNKS